MRIILLQTTPGPVHTAGVVSARVTSLGGQCMQENPAISATEALIRRAFPEGVGDEHYWALLAFLEPHFSQRNLATVMELVSHKSYPEAYNDGLAIESNSVSVPATQIEMIAERLRPVGLEDWLKIK